VNFDSFSALALCVWESCRFTLNSCVTWLLSGVVKIAYSVLAVLMQAKTLRPFFRDFFSPGIFPKFFIEWNSG